MHAENRSGFIFDGTVKPGKGPNGDDLFLAIADNDCGWISTQGRSVEEAVDRFVKLAPVYIEDVILNNCLILMLDRGGLHFSSEIDKPLKEPISEGRFHIVVPDPR